MPKGLPIEYREIRRLEKENKELHKRLEDWIYELAYYTEDEVATPKGVKKFVGNLLKLLEQYKFDIKVERSLKAQPKLSKGNGLLGNMEELSNYTVDLVEKNFPKGKCKERGAAIVLHAEMLMAIVKFSKPLSKSRIEEILTKEYCRDKHFVNNNNHSNATLNVISSEKKWIAEAIYKASNAQSEQTAQ